jgi:hypothetical protein
VEKAVGTALALALKGLWGLLRRVPWQLWMFLALVLAFYGYGEHKEAAGEERGRAAVQARWDAAVERGRQEIARLDRENAAKDERARLEAEAIGVQRERDHWQAITDRNRLVADLRTGNQQLRQQFRACLSRAPAAPVGPVPGGPVPAGPVRPADALDMAGAVAGSIFIADDAESRVNRLLAYVSTLQTQCGARSATE